MRTIADVAWRHVRMEGESGVWLALSYDDVLPNLYPGGVVSNCALLVKCPHLDALLWLLEACRAVSTFSEWDEVHARARERGVVMQYVTLHSPLLLTTEGVSNEVLWWADRMRTLYLRKLSKRKPTRRGRRHKMRVPKGDVTWPS